MTAASFVQVCFGLLLLSCASLVGVLFVSIVRDLFGKEGR